MHIERDADIISGHYEATTTVTHLPRCRNCGAMHPLARTPKMPDDKCPDCGAPSAIPQTQEVPAVLTSRAPMMLLANMLLWLGRFFHNLAGKDRK